MIRRKCRTEKPAKPAALGISRNIRFVATTSMVFIASSLKKGSKCTWGANPVLGSRTPYRQMGRGHLTCDK